MKNNIEQDEMVGVLLAGGFGKRLYPFTKTVTNKHLAPVYTNNGAIPMINYPIDTLNQMGIKKVLIITSKEHCGAIVEHLGDGYDIDMEFTYKIQSMDDPKRPAGIASALKLAKDFTGNSNFVVILGDNYFEWNDEFKFTINKFSMLKSSCGLFLHEVENWEDYGVATLNNQNNIIDIIEKPKKFISNLAVTGMYLYTSEVYNYLDKLTPSQRGELEITDINKMYSQKGVVDYLKFNTFWGDMGTPKTMLKTQKFINEN